jgi:hypothetical protein
MRFIKQLQILKKWEYPWVTGAIIGIPCGIYSGYKDTQKYSLEYNVVGTIIGGVGGFFTGGILGFFWPITIPVIISRNYNLEIKK